MTKIVVSIPFYLGEKAGKPAFYPVGRGDAPDADLGSPFGLALEKGGYFTRVTVSEATATASDTPAQDETAATAEKSVEPAAESAESEATATASDTPAQDETAATAEKSGEPAAENVEPEATATASDTPAQDETAATAKKSKKSTTKESSAE